MDTEICPFCTCGFLRVKPTLLTRPFRHLPSLTAAYVIDVLTCDRCGGQLFDKQTAKALNAALEAALEP